MKQLLFLLAFIINLIVSVKFDSNNKAPQPGIDHFEPVIGIFAQPSEDINDHYPASEGYSYIPSSYVKWVESAGGRVVPIPYNLNDTTLYYLLERINGFLIPGGDASLWVNETTHTGYANQTITGAKVLKKVLEYNKDGFFPLWATCMGYEMVSIIVTKDVKVLDNFNSTNHSLNTIISEPRSMIYSNIPQHLHTTIQKNKAFYYNHRYGLSVNHFTNLSSLNKNYNLTSWSSSNSKMFVATLEGKGAYKNQFLSQYHPEKNQYEWLPTINSNHDPLAIQASQYEAYMFLDVARKSFHKFDSFEDFSKYSIINHKPVSCLNWKGSHTVQVYVFQARKDGSIDIKGNEFEF